MQIDAAETAQTVDPSQQDLVNEQARVAERRAWVLPHREELLVVARRRTASAADAEDCVHEAMIRAVQHESLDKDRVGAFLCTTLLRLIVDGHRDRERSERAGVREWRRQVPAAGHEEIVCQRDQARWLVSRLGDLRGRESQLLHARAQGMSVSEFAAAEGLSVKAAENAWTRVRQKAQRALATAAGLLAPLAFFRRGGVVAAPAAVLVAAVIVLELGLAEPKDRTTVPPGTGEAVSATAAPVAAEPGPVARAVPVDAAAAERPLMPAPQQHQDTSGRDSMSGSAPAQHVADVPDLDVAAVEVGPVRTGSVEGRRKHPEDSFEETVAKCLRNVDLSRPLADPCDY